MTQLKVIFGVVALLTLLTGCQNTVQGLGKDMQRTGQELEHSGQ